MSDMPETTTNKAEAKEKFTCRECGAGVMHLEYITYFTWLDEELVTVPNFPAWVCDVCGQRQYDERAILMLSALLNPDAGKDPARQTRKIRVPAHRRNSTRPSTE